MRNPALDIQNLAGIERDLAIVAGITAITPILDVICRMTGMGFAAVARVTETSWTPCAVRDGIGLGLAPGLELPLKTTLCAEVCNTRAPIVIDNVSEDPIYRNHHTPGIYGIQSHISFPIILTDGRLFGTLCAIDPNPAPVSRPDTVETFRLFAELIAFHIDAVERANSSEAALIDARDAGELREQFVAILGHDLRNPLAAIQAGTTLLQRRPLDDASRNIVAQVRDSAIRMERLIEDVLDFARGRLGGGIPLAPQPVVDLQGVIQQVIGELQSAWPDRAIVADLALTRPVACDPGRVGQLLSNLLANALTHGSADGPVHVRASSEHDVFELTVSNTGTPIAEHALPQLFQPFKSQADGLPQAGLGLGLYIAAQIAKGHGGMLDVQSTTDLTQFRFSMPLSLEV